MTDHFPFVEAGKLAAFRKILPGIGGIFRSIATCYNNLLRPSESLEAAICIVLDFLTRCGIVQSGIDIFVRAITKLNRDK